MLKVLLYILFASLTVIDADTKMGNCHNCIIDERLPNIIDKDMTLVTSKIYGIDKKVLVTNGATLTIEPGTTLAGCSLFSVLVISQNSRIIARGTKQKPIIFTSQIDLLGFSSQKGVGEWGGVVIAGNAYTHYNNNKYEADESVSFGSSNHDHDEESSGILEYVAIKHTGYEVKKDKELNGLSLAGVGKGTRIENIAIIGGKDDGIEIWGGTVNINGLFVYNAMDDSVDVDLGYRGEIKNVLVIQEKVASSNNHDSSAIEIGNDEEMHTPDKKSVTLPYIRNFTGHIKGGGIYNKYDAGFILQNVQLLSDKRKDNEMVFFRGKNSYKTGEKYFYDDVCLFNEFKGKKIADYLSRKNSKGIKQNYTPYKYFLLNNKGLGNSKFKVSQSCAGVHQNNIWTAGIKQKD